jgi:hypothetical protein
LSISESHRRATDFDGWIAAEFAERGAFTILVVLVEIDEIRVTPLSSTFLHVIGDEIGWGEIGVLFAGSGVEWDGASFFPVSTSEGHPLDNFMARSELRKLKERLDEDRLVLNEGHFFDKWGRRMKVEEIPLQ